MPIIERFIQSSADITNNPCGGFQVDDPSSYMGWRLRGKDRVQASFEAGNVVGLVIIVRANWPRVHPPDDHVAAAYEITQNQAANYEKGDMIRQYMAMGTDGSLGEDKGFNLLWLTTDLRTHNTSWGMANKLLEKGISTAGSKYFDHGRDDFPRVGWVRVNKPPPPSAGLRAGRGRITPPGAPDVQAPVPSAAQIERRRRKQKLMAPPPKKPLPQPPNE